MLNINHLSVTYHNSEIATKAVNDVSLAICQSEIVGLVGESGSGKTTIANSILDLLPEKTEIAGKTFFDGKELSQKTIQTIRGKDISYISQNFYTSLDKNIRIGKQFDLILRSNTTLNRKARKEKIFQIMTELNFHNVEEVLSQYPFQLSGGMLQRVIIAMAIVLRPKILVADEPTSAIDSMSKNRLLALLATLKEKFDLGILIISHDLRIIKDYADTLVVLYQGEVMEKGKNSKIYNSPRHPYTKMLLESKPDFKKKILREKKLLRAKQKCVFSPYCPECNGVCNSDIKAVTEENYYCKCNVCKY